MTHSIKQWAGDLSPTTLVVKASEHDALAAQCDEGLAREARLRSEISIYQNEYVKYSEFEELQQRLTEAEKLIGDVIDCYALATVEHEDLEQELCDFRNRVASPGCSDEAKE